MVTLKKAITMKTQKIVRIIKCFDSANAIRNKLQKR